MIKIGNGTKIMWRQGVTMADLLQHFKENRSFVGAVINGRYVSKSHFSRTKIPDQAVVHIIPWHEGMTVAELLSYEIDEYYFFAATVDGRLIPEAKFYTTVIPEEAEVWLLPPVGGG